MDFGLILYIRRYNAIPEAADSRGGENGEHNIFENWKEREKKIKPCTQHYPKKHAGVPEYKWDDTFQT